jgi:hypothetical protein
VCIVLIKDKNCNTVCTSPEGGMDIQIKTLHRCMNEYNFHFLGAIKSLKKRIPPSLSDFREKWLENQEIKFE